MNKNEKKRKTTEGMLKPLDKSNKEKELNIVKGEIRVLQRKVNFLEEQQRFASEQLDFLLESLKDIKRKIILSLISLTCVGCGVLCALAIYFPEFFNS